ncbi:MAG TPA: TIGR00366 family protein [Terriglobales bacterium]|nr:TIGR00366 family protein [Terriglobales bacterium]
MRGCRGRDRGLLSGFLTNLFHTLLIVTTQAIPIQEQQNPRVSFLTRASSSVVYLMERILPDPYVFALLLTFITAILAFTLTPSRSVGAIGLAWYNGVFNILTFAFQMVLILVTGYALASSPLIHRALEKLASIPETPRNAVSLTIVIGMIASWLNWGFGLVIAGLLAREIAKRVHLDFGWLVAAAYTGFVISTEGLSGSIVLSQATPGSALNLVEKVTGHGLPLRATVFSALNLVPVVALFALLPVIFRYTEPTQADSVFIDPGRLKNEDQQGVVAEKTNTLGAWLDRAWILTMLLVALGLVALAEHWRSGFSIDLNAVILIFLLLGLVFHLRPIRYVVAIKNAARVTGPLILQYPLYGGIMGIMTATGLAGIISKSFLAVSTARSLPFWTYISSLIITLFVPSGGGHWAVQGPFVLPAAKELHASMAGTTMAVAMGESVANMLQPFFALPILAIAGIGMRRMMGYMVITFLTALTAFALSLVFLLPR